MTSRIMTGRREFLGGVAAAGVAACAPPRVLAQQRLPVREIPGTGETLPIIGLGSSKVVSEIAAEGTEPLAAVLRTLIEHGGSVVDTWPRDAANDAGFGRVVSAPEFADRLFVTMKIDREGKEAGLEQFRETQRLYRRETFDLAQIFSLTDLETHWPTLMDMKASGAARYIGVTVAEYRLYDRLAAFIERESPDFVQVNYSITERRAEERLLPALADRGIAVLINRPFMNGAYFDRLEGVALPGWAQEIGCESWAQFSLKYILAHPAVTCVLTETTNPAHMEENIRAAFGELPGADVRRRMRELIEQV
ncbi:MAG: aldo/keto reductase [Gammaproteobacteria bacterium]|nr:aldo/keto reductase [Gammaproteobacteria bacterium]